MLEVNNLKTHFRTQDGLVKAVDGVSFSLEAGETMGIVGESGSGKSVTALSIMQLNPKPPAEYPEGEILFEDQDLLKTSDKRMQEIRGNDIAMIFQDPMTSLNPVFTVGNQIREAIPSIRTSPRARLRRRQCRCSATSASPTPRGWPRSTRTSSLAVCASGL